LRDNMRYAKSFLLAAMLLIMTVEPISAIGIGESAPYWGSGSKEYYCAAHGGNPQGGNCYFPDGSYCDLGSFYNGTCPGRGYYEQAAWMAEAYRFLDGDEAYYSPYISNQGAATPYGYSYSYSPVQSNYWPFYPQQSALVTPVPIPTINQPAATQFYTIGAGGTGWVQGRIMSRRGVPIPMASIIVDGLRTSAASNEQGYYEIALSPGQHRIDADKTGYGIPPRLVRVFAGQNTTLDLTGREVAVLGTGR
jgi:hypothetical protein